ncbi:hypothetical protein ACVWWO_002140 [Bradyrhizobium sp. F1.13.1]
MRRACEITGTLGVYWIRTATGLYPVLTLVVPIIGLSREHRGRGFLQMLKDGTYRAWLKTPLGQGTGIAHVATGRIWGRSSIMTYNGTCEVDGDRFTAIVSIKRHTDEHVTIFGADDLTLKLEGTCSGKIGRYVGTAEEVPGVLFEGTLILTEEEPPSLKASESTPTFNPNKLPKLPKRSR